jgi:hypothetical protein
MTFAEHSIPPEHDTDPSPPPSLFPATMGALQTAVEVLREREREHLEHIANLQAALQTQGDELARLRASQR